MTMIDGAVVIATGIGLPMTVRRMVLDFGANDPMNYE